jgi:UDP-N-acetylglucosamine 2-epimerase (non-hydrolysing)
VKLDLLREVLCKIGRSVPLLFPIHPRTRKKAATLGKNWDPVKLIDPLGYLDFLGLMAKARIVLTDSGGIQEETTALGVPCATLRDNTERPITVQVGTNRLAGTSPGGILATARELLATRNGDARTPELWDGKASIRVVDVVQSWQIRKQ